MPDRASCTALLLHKAYARRRLSYSAQPNMFLLPPRTRPRSRHAIASILVAADCRYDKHAFSLIEHRSPPSCSTYIRSTVLRMFLWLSTTWPMLIAWSHWFLHFYVPTFLQLRPPDQRLSPHFMLFFCSPLFVSAIAHGPSLDQMHHWYETHSLCHLRRSRFRPPVRPDQTRHTASLWFDSHAAPWL